jgi:FtsH-binding integral membrane protein
MHDLRDVTFGQLYLGWTVIWALILGPVALGKARNDFWSIFLYVGAAGGVAGVLAAFFSGPMWVVIQIVK